MKLDLFRCCLAHDQKSPERGNVANASGKEVDFASSLIDKQHEFNSSSLEVNKIRQSRHSPREEWCAKMAANLNVFKKF